MIAASGAAGASTLERMHVQLSVFERDGDPRGAFLACYSVMTRNMLAAIEAGAFDDPRWVGALLARFSDYYFDALDLYARDASSAPPVWRMAHDAASRDGVAALQHLLLGVNAHINYDLVLTLIELLEDEWRDLDQDGRRRRLEDHRRVNEHIARSIDEVQDDVLERHQPSTAVIDAALGRLDEWLIARLLARWREQVWEHAAAVLESPHPEERRRMLRGVEAGTLWRGRAVLHPNVLTLPGRLL